MIKIWNFTKRCKYHNQLIVRIAGNSGDWRGGMKENYMRALAIYVKNLSFQFIHQNLFI
jgi:hypothetical protein